jgi:hypothetical protein
MKMKYTIFLFFMFALANSTLLAQSQGGVLSPEEQSLPTLLSIRLSGGYGIARGSENIGTNGSNPIWWSAGQGVKMDLAIDIPLLPIEVINSDPDENEPEKFSIVGLEAEFGSGYHISSGGTTSDGFQTVSRTYTYVPVTFGFNARATFGAGMPSVYIGGGGGVDLKAIYEDNITFVSSATTKKNIYDPPLPFELYGQMGLEIPLLYSPDDGNSMLDFFAQARLTEVTNYLYTYTQTTTTPTSNSSIVLGNNRFDHPASNVAFTIGIKYNLY